MSSPLYGCPFKITALERNGNKRPKFTQVYPSSPLYGCPFKITALEWNETEWPFCFVHVLFASFKGKSSTTKVSQGCTWICTYEALSLPTTKTIKSTKLTVAKAVYNVPYTACLVQGTETGQTLHGNSPEITVHKVPVNFFNDLYRMYTSIPLATGLS